MGEDAEIRGATTREGFRVLGVGIRREPKVFTVATLGAVPLADCVVKVRSPPVVTPPGPSATTR